MKKIINTEHSFENKWYAYAYRLSDPVLLGFIKQHYADLGKEIKADPTLTSSEREDAITELWLDKMLSVDWYVWDNCFMCDFFDTQVQAEEYINKFRDNNSYSPEMGVLSPDEFQECMAQTEPDHVSVYQLKKYLLTLRDAPQPRYRVT